MGLESLCHRVVWVRRLRLFGLRVRRRLRQRLCEVGRGGSRGVKGWRGQARQNKGWREPGKMGARRKGRARGGKEWWGQVGAMMGPGWWAGAAKEWRGQGRGSKGWRGLGMVGARRRGRDRGSRGRWGRARGLLVQGRRNKATKRRKATSRELTGSMPRGALPPTGAAPHGAREGRGRVRGACHRATQLKEGELRPPRRLCSVRRSPLPSVFSLQHEVLPRGIPRRSHHPTPFHLALLTSLPCTRLCYFPVSASQGPPFHPFRYEVPPPRYSAAVTPRRSLASRVSVTSSLYLALLLPRLSLSMPTLPPGILFQGRTLPHAPSSGLLPPVSLRSRPPSPLPTRYFPPQAAPFPTRLLPA